MSDITFVRVKDWQEARDILPDQPVILVWFYNNAVYMRYRGEFYNIDDSSYNNGLMRRQRWSIAGITFNDDSAAWMIDNSIAFPFSAEDFMLYQLTWGLSHE